MDRPTETTDVIVVGAGLAGLCAAYELEKAGRRVTLLEARARPGGRVCTLREPFADGLYAEAGAMAIGNGDTRTLEFARRFALPLDDITDRLLGARCWFPDRIIDEMIQPNADWPFPLSEDERPAGLLGILLRYVLPALSGLGDPSHTSWPCPNAAVLDGMSFKDFLLKQGASDGAVSLLDFCILRLMGEGAAHLSALSSLMYLSHFVNSQRAFAIQGGNDRLPEALAQQLKGTIHYRAPVSTIVQDDRGVHAIFSHNGSERMVRGDLLVCAIPASVLRELDVSPEFSKDKRRAIQSLRYTPVTRFYLQVKSRWWKREGIATGQVATESPLMWIEDHTSNQAGPRGILEVHTAGPRARALDELSDDEQTRFVMKHLERIYPRIADEVEKSSVLSWQREPWNRGGYAHFEPGEMTALFAPLRLAEGRIHFAGDHTAASGPSLEGALESGMRAARECAG